jgi:hypothetical protein
MSANWVLAGGPDEDYTNCELECTSVSGEYIGTAIAIEQVGKVF